MDCSLCLFPTNVRPRYFHRDNASVGAKSRIAFKANMGWSTDRMPCIPYWSGLNHSKKDLLVLLVDLKVNPLYNVTLIRESHFSSGDIKLTLLVQTYNHFVCFGSHNFTAHNNELHMFLQNLFNFFVIIYTQVSLMIFYLN